MSGKVSHSGHNMGARNKYVNCLRVPSGQDRSRGLMTSSSPLPPPSPAPSVPPMAPLTSCRFDIEVQSTTAETPASVFVSTAVAAETEADAAVASLTMNDSTGVISERPVLENCSRNPNKKWSLQLEIWMQYEKPCYLTYNAGYTG